MKLYLTTLLIIVFSALAVFSIVAMGHQGMGHSDCLATAASGGNNCPSTDPVDYAAFHLNAFRTFSTAVFSGLLLLTLFIGLAVALWSPEVKDHMRLAPVFVSRRSHFVRNYFKERNIFNIWFARVLEGRDA